MSTYFKNISEGISTTLTGMQLTLRHLWSARNRRKPGDIRSDNFYDQQEGLVTIQYPLETIPIPDNGRYRLHNEIDDCIVCDKCVKVCPVDCIDIEPIRAIEEVGRASDGSPIRLYAAKFDIDMAKCCYCGLCTTVCPTECLTMTKTFDYSEFDVRDMVYNYANLTAEEADEKRMLLDQFQKEKEALKSAKKPVVKTEEREEGTKQEEPAVVAKPAFQPRKPIFAKADSEEKNESEVVKAAAPFKPSMKPKVGLDESIEKPVSETSSEAAPAKPAFRPTMKPKTENKVEAETEKEIKPERKEGEEVKPKAIFRPTMKPKPSKE